MKPLQAAESTTALTEWLATYQGYQVNPETAARIGAVVKRFKEVESSLGTDTLFWTEPSVLDTVLAAQSPQGIKNE